MTAGYWHTNYFPLLFWPTDFWPEYVVGEPEETYVNYTLSVVERDPYTLSVVERDPYTLEVE